MKKFLIVAFAALFSVIGMQSATGQSSNPFNPDYAWCAVQGSVVTRKAATWGCLLPGTAGQVLRSNGPGADANWLTVSGTGTVTSVGLAMPSFITVTGSPVTAAGTLTGTLTSQTANQLFIAPNGSAGAPTFRAMAAADMPNAGVTNGTGVSGTFPTLNIGTSAITNTMLANASVSFAKIQANAVDNTILAQMPAHTVKSNVTGSTANAADNSLSAILDADTSSTQGSIIYRGATTWNALAPSSGNILQSNGPGANPTWVAPSAAIPAAVGIGHRLTISSGIPILTSAVASATTVYSTPFESDLLLLWNGTNFVPTHCAETSQLLSDATKSPAAAIAATNYDMFAWNDAGTCRVTRGPAWTNATTRSAGTAIARTNFGILTNSVAITNGPGINAGTYMGTIRTDAGGATISFLRDATSTACTVGANIPVWNMYNRAPTVPNVTLSQVSHTYSGGLRSYNGQSACAINVIRGLDDDILSARFNANIRTNTVSVGQVAIGVDSVVANSGIVGSQVISAGTIDITSTSVASWDGTPGIGYHSINALENTAGQAVIFNDLNVTQFDMSLRF